MKSFSFLLLLLLLSVYVTGQDLAPLKGIVTDSSNGTRLAGATVTLEKSGPGQTKLHSITDQDGQFIFTGIRPGEYILSVSLLAYKNYVIIITQRSPALTLNIQLSPVSAQLQNVTVVAGKEVETHSGSKIVITVAASSIASVGTAADALQKLPGASYFGNTLSFRGKPVLVLVDGRPVNLKDEELKNYLNGISANTIDRIEVIQNPSSKYDAEGSVVINIKTIKNNTAGFTGTTSAGIGCGHFLRENLGQVIAYKNNKVSFFTAFDFLHNRQYYKGRIDMNFKSGNFIAQQDYEIRERNNYSLRAGLDYIITKKTLLSISFRGYINYRYRDYRTNASSYGNTRSLDSASTIQNDAAASYTSPSVNISYSVKTDTSGGELVITADYFRYIKKSADDYLTRFYDAASQEYKSPLVLNAHSPADNEVKSVSVDWNKRLKELQLEGGFKISRTVIDNDIAWQRNTAAGWQQEADKTDHNIYSEQVYAGYINLNRQTKKIELQAGLRIESTGSKGVSITSSTRQEKNYVNLFPAFSCRLPLKKKTELSIGYRKSVQRPAFNILNSFINYISQYYYIQGNPLVAPSLNHNFNISYSIRSVLVLSANYTYTQSPLISYYKQNPLIEGVISTYANSTSTNIWSFSANYKMKAWNKKLVSTNTAGINLTRLYDRVNTYINRSAYSGYFTSNNTAAINKKLTAEATFSYTSATISAAEKFEPSYLVNLGLGLSVFKTKGTLRLSLADVLNTQVFRYTITTDALLDVHRYKIESRFISLNFSYKFGSAATKVNTAKKSGIEEEKSRI